MLSEEELINLDYDGLSDTDILVLLIVDGVKPVSPSRLQRLAFLYRELYKSLT